MIALTRRVGAILSSEAKKRVKHCFEPLLSSATVRTAAQLTGACMSYEGRELTSQALQLCLLVL